MSVSSRLIAGFVLLAGPVWGESVAEFYKGKTLRIVVGLGPGGATDTNARLISHVLSRHIPGNPRIIVQNKPGGGSMLAANTVYNNEPQDGTVLAAIWHHLSVSNRKAATYPKVWRNDHVWRSQG